VLGYWQVEKYDDDVIFTTEGNAVSYGVEADYIHNLNEYVGLYAGVALGAGNKDLGTNLLGDSNHKFRDSAIRSGGLIKFGENQIEVGAEVKKREYDRLTYGGYTLDIDESIVSFYAGFNFSL